jgi:hypothetical protein
MTVSIKKKVFWLQVAINDVSRVKILERQSHFCSIKLGDWIGEALKRHLA